MKMELIKFFSSHWKEEMSYLEIRSLKKEDRDEILSVLKSCNVFSEREIRVAMELIDLSISGSPDYMVDVLSDGKKVIGYACYGENPLALRVWDLYWICISPDFQGRKYGEILLKKVERTVMEKGGNSIFIETSSLPSYERARKFYKKLGYKIVSVIKDYYKTGDDKIIYRKNLV